MIEVVGWNVTLICAQMDVGDIDEYATGWTRDQFVRIG